MLCTKYCCPQLIVTKTQKEKNKTILGNIQVMILFPSAVSYKHFFFFPPLEVRSLLFWRFHVPVVFPRSALDKVFSLYLLVVSWHPLPVCMPLFSHSSAFLRHVTTPRKNSESRSFQRGSYSELHILHILNCIRSSCLKYYTYFNCKD